MLRQFLLENSNVFWYSMHSLNPLRKICETTEFCRCLLTNHHVPGTLLSSEGCNSGRW